MNRLREEGTIVTFAAGSINDTLSFAFAVFGEVLSVFDDLKGHETKIILLDEDYQTNVDLPGGAVDWTRRFL